MNISFVGTEEEIKFIQKRNTNLSKILWVPLSLDALVYLDLKNEEYINPLNYFTNLDHKKGIDFQKKYINLIKSSKNLKDSLLLRYNSIIGKFINSIFLIITIFNNLKKEIQIDSIIVSGWTENNYTSKNKNNFISLICSEIFKNEKVNFKTIKIIDYSIEHISYSYKLQESKLPNEKYLLINNPFYNFKRIVPHAKKNNFKIYYFEFNDLGFLKKNFYKFSGINPIIIKRTFLKKELKILKKNKRVIKYKYFDLTLLLNFKKILAENEIENIKKQNKIIQSFMLKRKPSIVIANLIRGFNGYLIELANKINIPTLSISHGTLSKGLNKESIYFQKKISEELISKKFTYIACQSKIFLSFLKQMKIKKYICTGNLIFSQTKPKKPKFILYAVTQRYFSNNHYYGIETFFEFYQNLKDFNNLAQTKKLNFMIKLHPNFSHLKDKLEKKFFNLKFTNEPLNKVLPFAKATISFSSSSIEDSLYSKVPVILYDPYGRYKHYKACDISGKLNEPIYYIKNIKNLEICLSSIISSEKIKFEKVIFNGDFENNFKKIFTSLK